jgi:hypothetical protein
MSTSAFVSRLLDLLYLHSVFVRGTLRVGVGLVTQKPMSPFGFERFVTPPHDSPALNASPGCDARPSDYQSIRSVQHVLPGKHQELRLQLCGVLCILHQV